MYRNIVMIYCFIFPYASKNNNVPIYHVDEHSISDCPELIYLEMYAMCNVLGWVGPKLIQSLY